VGSPAIVVDAGAAVLVVAAIVVVVTGKVVDVAVVVAGEATDASVSAPAAHEATVIKINAELMSRGSDRLPPTMCRDTICSWWSMKLKRLQPVFDPGHLTALRCTDTLRSNSYSVRRRR
jgi:hypothetical protein